MRNYKEIAERVRQRGDKILAERKRRSAVIMRIAFSASGLCAAVIIGVGLWHNSAVKNAAEPHTLPNAATSAEDVTDVSTADNDTGDIIVTAVTGTVSSENGAAVTTVSSPYDEYVPAIIVSGTAPQGTSVTSKQEHTAAGSKQVTTTVHKSVSTPTATTAAKSQAATTAKATNAVQTTAIHVTTVTSNSTSSAGNTTVTYKPPVTIPVTESIDASQTTAPYATTVPYATTGAAAATTTTAVYYTYTTTKPVTTSTTTCAESSGWYPYELPEDADYDDITLPDGRTYVYSGKRWYASELSLICCTELHYSLCGGIENVTDAVNVYYMSDMSVLVGYPYSDTFLQFDST